LGQVNNLGKKKPLWERKCYTLYRCFLQNQKVLEMLSHHNLLYDFEHLIKASMLLGNCLEAQIVRLLGINVSDEHLEEDRARGAKCFVLAKDIVEPAFHKLKCNNRELGFLNIYVIKKSTVCGDPFLIVI
jgi:hypothetical protein